MATRRKILPQYLTLGEEGKEIYTPIIQAAAEVKNTAPQPETPAAADTYTYRQTAPDYSKYASPAYSGSKWDDDYEAAVNAAKGMNYTDWTQGTDYASLAARYANQGQRAMTNTLGEYAARTGGVASSYAVSAAQQQYNQYMQQLEEVARQMFENERSQRYDDVAMLQSLAENDYNRYKDELSRYNTDRNFAYDIYADDRNFQYGREMDQQEFDYRRELDALDTKNAATNDARNRVEMFFAAGKTADDIPPELKAAAGYSDAELEAMQSYYAPLTLTDDDAMHLKRIYGRTVGDKQVLTQEEWDDLMAELEYYNEGEEWAEANGFMLDLPQFADTGYETVAKAAAKAGLDAPVTRAAYEAGAPGTSGFSSYDEYLRYYEQYIESKKNT